MAIDQFVAGQRVVLPGQHIATKQHEGRLGEIERAPGPARFELVSDVLKVVETEMATWMGIPSDMEGFRLIGVGAFVLTAASGVIYIQIQNLDTATDMLSTQCEIDAGDTSSYESGTQPVVDEAVRTVFTGQRLAVNVNTAATDGVGLAVALSFA